MKGIVPARGGAPDLVELREIEPPAVADGTVRIEVHAASVNAADWHLLATLPRLLRRFVAPKAAARGFDLAGVVEAVGSKVSRFKPGDAVFGVAAGAFAELAATTEERLAEKPASLDFEGAAAIPMAGITALQGLRDFGALRPGQRVLVYGAGGGVGTFAVQIAKALGAHVTAVSRRESLERLRAIGADEVVDHEREDFAARDDRYDLFFDVGANRSFADCRRVVRAGGSIVVVGAPKKIPAIVGRMLRARFASRDGVRVVAYTARVRRADLETLRELAEAGKLVPVLDRVVPLNETGEAIRSVGAGGVRGKIVVRVRPSRPRP